MKKMLFIYNPNAGTGKLKPKLADVLDILDVYKRQRKQRRQT